MIEGTKRKMRCIKIKDVYVPVDDKTFSIRHIESAHYSYNKQWFSTNRYRTLNSHVKFRRYKSLTTYRSLGNDIPAVEWGRARELKITSILTLPLPPTIALEQQEKRPQRQFRLHHYIKNSLRLRSGGIDSLKSSRARLRLHNQDQRWERDSPSVPIFLMTCLILRVIMRCSYVIHAKFLLRNQRDVTIVVLRVKRNKGRPLTTETDTSQRRGRFSIALKDPLFGEEHELFTRNLIQDRIQPIRVLNRFVHKWRLTRRRTGLLTRTDEPDFSFETRADKLDVSFKTDEISVSIGFERLMRWRPELRSLSTRPPWTKVHKLKNTTTSTPLSPSSKEESSLLKSSH